MRRARDQAVSAMTWCIQTREDAEAILNDFAREVIEAEKAALVKDIQHYFAAVDEDLFDDVKTLCGRITRGECGTRIQGQVQPDPQPPGRT